MVVNIVSACVVMCVVPVSLFLMPLFSVCLCYVCLRFHSSTPALKRFCSVSFTYCVFDVWPMVLLSLCLWYGVSVFLVISVFFMAFWCWCCVHSGLSHRHLWFYLCIILGLSEHCCPYVIICHNQGGDLFLWQHCKMLPGMCQCILFLLFFYYYPVMNNNSEFAAWWFWMIFHIFSIFIKHVVQWRNLCFCLWLQFLCNICVCLCLHGCKWALLHLPQSMVWSRADGCLVPKGCDSWSKLEPRAQVMIGKGGRAREVIIIKPLQREHRSASFPLLVMWHRCKTPPRLIYRAAHTLNKFILKLAVKQN